MFKFIGEFCFADVYAVVGLILYTFQSLVKNLLFWFAHVLHSPVASQLRSFIFISWFRICLISESIHCRIVKCRNQMLNMWLYFGKTLGFLIPSTIKKPSCTTLASQGILKYHSVYDFRKKLSCIALPKHFHTFSSSQGKHIQHNLITNWWQNSFKLHISFALSFFLSFLPSFLPSFLLSFDAGSKLSHVLLGVDHAIGQLDQQRVSESPVPPWLRNPLHTSLEKTSSQSVWRLEWRES